MKAGIKLGDICDILNGFAFKSEKYVCEGVRIIRIANVQKGYLEDSAPQYYPLETASEFKKYLLEEGDILMSLTGNVGRVARLSANMLPAALNQRVACLRLKDSAEISKDFLFQFLNSDYFESHCILSSKGIAQKNMSTEWLKEYEIPLFTPKEQLVIASQLSKIDILIAGRYQMLVKLDELVKSRFVEMFGDPKCNPMHWEQQPLYKILEAGSSVSYGIVQTGDHVQDGVPVFRPSDIADGKIPQRQQLKCTTAEISNQYSRTLLKGYELLISVRGSVGETFQVTDEFKDCNVGRNIVPLRFDTNMVLYPFMQSLFDQDGIKTILSAMTKGIALQGLNMSEFREVDIILPPISLQRDFVAFREQTDKSKLAVQQSLEKLETLKKSLMQQYFG